MAPGFAIFKMGLVAVFVFFAFSCRIEAEEAVTCNDVVNSLLPCLSYVTGGALQPACCNGVRAMDGAARTTDNRRSICRCLRSVVGNSYNSNSANLAAGLPAKCGVNLPFKISPTTDCNTVP